MKLSAHNLEENIRLLWNCLRSTYLLWNNILIKIESTFIYSSGDNHYLSDIWCIRELFYSFIFTHRLLNFELIISVIGGLCFNKEIFWLFLTEICATIPQHLAIIILCDCFCVGNNDVDCVIGIQEIFVFILLIFGSISIGFVYQTN